ncbi:MAG: metal ABC transporter substrate-binding protein [Thermoplasmatota archaeon]
MQTKRKTNMILFLFVGLLTVNMFIPLSLAEDESINIVCTNSVLADFTSNIITENASIEYIMPAGACPAHFDTSPSDVSKIVNADIIVSLGWEPWLESLLNKSGNNDYTEIKCMGLGEWNIPTGAIAYVQIITEGLITALPGKSSLIQQQSNNYQSEINDTAETLKNNIINQNFTERKVVCMEWQKDFLEWIGLNVTYYYPPPESLSVQDELDVVSAASQHGVAAVIDNLQSGTAFGAQVASESGVSHVIFTNFPGAIPNTDTYLDMITYNTDQLIKGINSFDYTTNQTRDLQNQLDSVSLQRNAFAMTTVFALIVCIILFVMYRKK